MIREDMLKLARLLERLVQQPEQARETFVYDKDELLRLAKELRKET